MTGRVSQNGPQSRRIEMNIIAAAFILVVGIAAESLLLGRARERAKEEEAVSARLARIAGRRPE